MLIEGTVHLNSNLSTKQKLGLNSDRLISMLLFKPHKIHFQFIEPEVERVFDMEKMYKDQHGEEYISKMAVDVKKLVIYHTKKRFKNIEDCVESYVVFIKEKTILFN